MPEFIKNWLENKRSRKNLRAWTHGWVWAMGELHRGRSVNEVESYLYYCDPECATFDGSWFVKGAVVAVEDFESATLQPESSAPSPGYVLFKGDPRMQETLEICLPTFGNALTRDMKTADMLMIILADELTKAIAALPFGCKQHITVYWRSVPDFETNPTGTKGCFRIVGLP